jgi:hypothetical protein
VYDKDKIWVAADGRRGAIIVGEGAGASCALSNAEIAQKVQQREQVRASKDFGAADTMRDELRACGVDIYDKEKIWKSNDGRQGRVGYGVHIQESVGVVGGAPDDAEIDTSGLHIQCSSSRSCALVVRIELTQFILAARCSARPARAGSGAQRLGCSRQTPRLTEKPRRRNLRPAGDMEGERRAHRSHCWRGTGRCAGWRRGVWTRAQQIGGSGGSLEPPGPLLEPPGPLLTHLHTSTPFIWRILSAFLRA